MNALDTFAAEVGPTDAGPVVAVGGRTQWDVGGHPATDAREVRAPVGVVEHEPAEMTVRVRAGTPVDELRAELATAGQMVVLPSWPGATVGGVLAVGHSGLDRLGRGPLRDAPLEVRYVSAGGDVVKAGGPTVKNVSGYDLPRLLVGSLGTLGLLAEVVLRTAPVPASTQWFESDRDPWALLDRLYRPSAVLWDGATSWVLLEGHPGDVAAQAVAAGLKGHEVEGPPPLPPHRWSISPRDVSSLAAEGHGRFVAEVGVGVVHGEEPQPPRPVPPAIAALHARVKAAFDPTGRLAPGRAVL